MQLRVSWRVGQLMGVGLLAASKAREAEKWGTVALMGITMMQWVEGLLWLDGPLPHGTVNKILTIALIPVALVAQAWGPLLGSAWAIPISKRKYTFYGLMTIRLALRGGFTCDLSPIHDADHTTGVSPIGGLPKILQTSQFGLMERALVIRMPFLIWWKSRCGRPAHLLVGMVLGDFKFPRHRQHQLLVFFCLLLRHFRLYLCVHDAGPNAGYCGRRES